MPEYLAPGVYVEEVDTGPKPIEGVSTSTSGMVGVTERGPLKVPTLVTGVAEFKRSFGWFLNRRIFTGDTWYLPHAVKGFFDNGGKRLYVVRVLPETAPAAALQLFDRGDDRISTRLACGALSTQTAVIVEDINNIEDGDWLRLDVEKFTEYVQANLNPPAALAHRGWRGLHAPLNFDHAAGPVTPLVVVTFTVAQDANHQDIDTTLTADAEAGQTVITLRNRDHLIQPDNVLKIGPAGPFQEFAVVAAVPLDSGDPTVTLRAPLAFDHAGDPDPAHAEHIVLVTEVPQAANTQLNQNVTGGAAVIIGDNFSPADFHPGQAGHPENWHILRIGAALHPQREYRLIANLTAYSLRNPLNADHPITEPVTAVDPTPSANFDQILAVPAHAGDQTITLDSRGDLAPGDRVTIGSGKTAESVLIQQVPADAADHSVTLSHPLMHDHPGQPDPKPDHVLRAHIDRPLAAAVRAGSLTVTLTDRQGLGPGDLVGIGHGTTWEYRVIREVPSDDKDLSVTLNHPLASDHPGQPDPNAHSLVRMIRAVVANAASIILQPLRRNQATVLLADGNNFATDVIIEIGPWNSPEVEYQTLANSPAPQVLGVTGLSGAEARGGLVHDHSPGAALQDRGELLLVWAIDPGAWGNDLQIKADNDDPILATKVKAANPNAADVQLTLNSTVGIEPGTVLEIDFSTGKDRRKVVAVNRNVVTLSSSLGTAVAEGTGVRTQEFQLTVELLQPNPLTGKLRAIDREVHRQLSLDPRHSRYAPQVVGAIFRNDNDTPRRADGRTEGESNLIRIEDILAKDIGVLTPAARTQAENQIRLGPDPVTDVLPDGRKVPVGFGLDNGDDRLGDLTDATYLGDDAVNPRDRTGLQALKNIEEIALVGIPGRTSFDVQQGLINHCELMRYRFAVLDSKEKDGMPEVQEHRGLYDSKYAALYYPWLLITDPFPDNPRSPGRVGIPPSGQVMGIYARTDIERGVHKAPANEVLRGIADLKFKLTKEEQDILNPRNINVLRNFREQNRGLRVWGARTISSDPDWKYINVRRLFIFVEHSIDRGTQWVVFEPNADPLWERVRRTVSSFLRNVWRDGALMGRTPEEAFFVKCDRTTMSQDDIDNGRLIVQVGLAAVKPAEFVIFRIGQWTGGSEMEEG